MSNTAGGNGSLGAEIFRKDALLKNISPARGKACSGVRSKVPATISRPYDWAGLRLRPERRP